MIRQLATVTALVISTTLPGACSRAPAPQDAAADAERAPGSESAPLATDETSPEAAHDALLRDSVTLLDNLNGTLDFVEDAETARVTKVDMDDLVERMHALKARRRQLGEPPGNVQESSQFAMEYLRMMGSWNRFMEHASRLAQNPAAMVHLQEPMQELLLFFDDQDRADDEPS